MAGSTAEGTPGNTPEWRKSTYSGDEANCIEVAALFGGEIAIRNDDSDHMVISATRDDFRAFVLGIKAGEFDDLI